MPLKNGRQSADLQTILVGSVIPSGTIAPFGGGTVPAGWMLCDGTAISRTTYSALFTAINTTYGIGDGASTFNLPNAQGVFLRGAGSRTISGTSYSATRGISQVDSMQGHWHTLGGTTNSADTANEPQATLTGSSGGRSCCDHSFNKSKLH